MAVFELPLFNYLYTQYIIQNKAMQQNSRNKCETRLFQEYFFPLTIIEWNKLDWKMKNSKSVGTFKKRILAFIRLIAPNSAFSCHYPEGIKLLSRLRLGF